MLAPGHTMKHQCVKVYSKNSTLLFLGDMVPTTSHVGLSYIMSFDLYPLETLKNKRIYFDQIIDEDGIVAFNHDPLHFFGKITRANKKYSFQPLNKSVYGISS